MVKKWTNYPHIINLEGCFVFLRGALPKFATITVPDEGEDDRKLQFLGGQEHKDIIGSKSKQVLSSSAGESQLSRCRVCGHITQLC